MEPNQSMLQLVPAEDNASKQPQPHPPVKKTKTARQKTRTTGNTELMRAGRQKRSTSISTACTQIYSIMLWLKSDFNRPPEGLHLNQHRLHGTCVHGCIGNPASQAAPLPPKPSLPYLPSSPSPAAGPSP